jgi:sugar O-acyltransferase (sialic acid O-acetyltransferase NeuD family)
VRLLLWGAGGHGKVVLDLAMLAASLDDLAFAVDSRRNGDAREFAGRPVHCLTDEGDPIHSRRYTHFVACVGNNNERAACFRTAADLHLLPATLIHPSAVVSRFSAIGAGSVLMANVVVNPGARIGENCIINTGAIVEHDCVVGDHVHLSPGVKLGGTVTIGDFAHLGIGAVVLPGLIVGPSAVVGAGAVVVRDVPPGITVVGVPARILQRQPK